jgi:hypothetical protein
MTLSVANHPVRDIEATVEHQKQLLGLDWSNGVTRGEFFG